MFPLIIKNVKKKKIYFWIIVKKFKIGDGHHNLMKINYLINIVKFDMTNIRH